MEHVRGTKKGIKKMDANITNHKTQENFYIWDIIDAHNDFCARTITLTSCLGDEHVIDLTTYDVMILAK